MSEQRVAESLQEYLQKPELVDGWITPDAVALKDGSVKYTQYFRTPNGGLLLRSALDSDSPESPQGLVRRFEAGERFIPANHGEQLGMAALVKSRTDNLQTIADNQRVSEVVYGWLKRCNLTVTEEGSEELCGVILALISGARAGLDRPTDAQVRADIEASNRFAMEHNALPSTKRKLPIIDLEKLSLGSYAV